jgi:hypothetical protein
MGLSDEVLAAVHGMDNTFDQATPDTDGSSAGQRWPEEGPCNSWLKSFVIDLETFRYEKNEIPGIAYKFGFETMDDPTGDNFAFNGAAFRFPQNMDTLKGTLPNNTRARVEIETNRLMGHFTSLLGARPASIEAGAVAVAKMVEEAEAGGEPVGLALNIVHQKRTYGDRTRTFPKEFITGLLSVVGPEPSA